MYGGVPRFMKSSGNALELRNTSLTHQHCAGSPPASVKRANKSRPFKQWRQAQVSQVRSDMRNAILRENNSLHIKLILRSFSTRVRGKELVNISASIFWFSQYVTWVTLLKTASRTKWWRMSMCFVLPWATGFLAIAIALWLSSLIKVGFLCGAPISSKSLQP